METLSLSQADRKTEGNETVDYILVATQTVLTLLKGYERELVYLFTLSTLVSSQDLQIDGTWRKPPYTMISKNSYTKTR